MLIVGVIFFNVNVGIGAFVCAVVLVLAECADDGEAIKRMPWRVIVMVMRRHGVDRHSRESPGHRSGRCRGWRGFRPRGTVTGVIAFIIGMISVYSSTSGVVLPAFLPMVPGLAQQLGGANPLGIA